MNKTLAYSKQKSCVTSNQSQCSEPCNYYEHGWFGLISQSPFYMNKECSLDETKMYASFLKHYEDLFTYTINEGSYLRQTQYTVSITYGDNIGNIKENPENIHPFYNTSLRKNQLLFNLLDMDRMLVKKNISIPFLLDSFYPIERKPVWIVMVRNKTKPCYMVSEELYRYIVNAKNIPFAGPLYKGMVPFIKIGNKSYAAVEFITDYNEIIRECYFRLIENKDLQPSDIFKPLSGIRYYEPYTPIEEVVKLVEQDAKKEEVVKLVEQDAKKEEVVKLVEQDAKKEEAVESKNFYFVPIEDIGYYGKKDEAIEFEDLENNAQEMTYGKILQYHFEPLVELETEEPYFYNNILKTLCIISLFTILIGRSTTILSDETVNNLWNQVNPILLEKYTKREMSNYTHTFIKNVILSIQIKDELNKHNTPSKAQLAFGVCYMIVISTLIVSLNYLYYINPQSEGLRKKIHIYKKQLDERDKLIKEETELQERILVSKQHRSDNPKSKAPTNDFCQRDKCDDIVYDWNKTLPNTHGEHKFGAERIFEPQMDSLSSNGINELEREGYNLSMDEVNLGKTLFSQNEMSLEKVFNTGNVFRDYLTGKISELPQGHQRPIYVARLHDGTMIVIDGHHRSAGWHFALNTTTPKDVLPERVHTKLPAKVFNIPEGKTVLQFMNAIGRKQGVQYKNLQDEIVYETGNPAFKATNQQHKNAVNAAEQAIPHVNNPKEEYMDPTKKDYRKKHKQIFDIYKTTFAISGKENAGLLITANMIRNSDVCKILDEYFNISGRFSSFINMVKSWLYYLLGDVIFDELKPEESK